MKLADYSDVVTTAKLDGALRAGNFEGVFHYLGDDFALREENPDVVADIRALGWPQAGIFVVRAPSSVSASGDVMRARAYGFPPGSELYLDVEPGVFDLDPSGWAWACDAWAPAIRAAGYVAGVYGVDRTVAACGNQMDRLWRAVPGMCDPAAAGPQGLNPAYKPGVRIVQCGIGLFNGVEFDISYSQFDIGGGMLTEEERTWLKGLFDGWFLHDKKLDEIMSGVAALTSKLDSLAAQGVPQANLQPLADQLAAVAADVAAVRAKTDKDLG